jgi:hypothetical protein
MHPTRLCCLAFAFRQAVCVPVLDPNPNQLLQKDPKFMDYIASWELAESPRDHSIDLPTVLPLTTSTSASPATAHRSISGLGGLLARGAPADSHAPESGTGGVDRGVVASPSGGAPPLSSALFSAPHSFISRHVPSATHGSPSRSMRQLDSGPAHLGRDAPPLSSSLADKPGFLLAGHRHSLHRPGGQGMKDFSSLGHSIFSSSSSTFGSSHAPMGPLTSVRQGLEDGLPGVVGHPGGDGDAMSEGPVVDTHTDGDPGPGKLKRAGSTEAGSPFVGLEGGPQGTAAPGSAIPVGPYGRKRGGSSPSLYPIAHPDTVGFSPGILSIAQKGGLRPNHRGAPLCQFRFNQAREHPRLGVASPIALTESAYLGGGDRPTLGSAMGSLVSHHRSALHAELRYRISHDKDSASVVSDGGEGIPMRRSLSAQVPGVHVDRAVGALGGSFGGSDVGDGGGQPRSRGGTWTSSVDFSSLGQDVEATLLEYTGPGEAGGAAAPGPVESQPVSKPFRFLSEAMEEQADRWV